MGLKNWVSRRREEKEKQERFGELSEDEVQDLHSTEKFAYLSIAKKQVTYRGKINAYKDFPVEEADKKEIDIEDKFVKEMNNGELDKKEEEEEEALNETEEVDEDEGVEEAPEIEINNEINKREEEYGVYPAVKRMR